MAITHLNQIQIGTLLRLAEKRPRDHALLAMSAYTALRISDIWIRPVEFGIFYGALLVQLILKLRVMSLRRDCSRP